MKGTLIATGEIWGRNAAALMVDGVLQDLLIDPPADGPPRVGTVFRAIVDRPMKGQGGQMVRLPGDMRGFLRQGKIAAPGRSILVQVSGYAEPGKAAPVTPKLALKGRYVIITPGADGVNVSRQISDPDRRAALLDLVTGAAPDLTGAILRSSCESAEDADIIAEILQTTAIADSIAAKANGQAPALLHNGPDARATAMAQWPGDATWADGPTAFADHGIDDLCEALRDPHVALPGGASAWIEPTRALVAIDANTGGDTSPAAGLKANIALCRDLPRQLRLRGLGGQIVIDFAPFPKRDRRQIEQILGQVLRRDGIETALVGWTPLGHFELQRKRARIPI